MSGFPDSFWDDDLEQDPIEAAQEAMKLRGADDRAPGFIALLKAVFPHGVIEPNTARGPWTVASQIGSHWVGIVGTTRPTDHDTMYEGFWRQNVAVLGHVDARGRTGRRGATIECATRRIKSDAGLAAWLSWVHRGICKTALETIRSALHPDAFMGNTSMAFRAGYDLHLINATWIDVEDLIIQRLPWVAGKGRGAHACHILRKGKKVGMLGVQRKGDHWRYGGEIQLASISTFFSLPPVTLKFKHEAATTVCKDGREGIERCEKLYASKLFEWLLLYGQQEGLRNT